MTIGQEGTGAPIGAPTLMTFGCPNCGWSGEFDDRFVQWCESCGFNADTAPEQPEKRRVARRTARARARAEQLCEQLTTAEDLRPTSATGVAVTVLSTLVHLVTVAVVVGSVLAVKTWASEYWWGWPLGVLGILVAIAVRPQLWEILRKPRDIDQNCLTRDKAPALFGLLDRCAAQLTAPVPDYVLMDTRFNAATRSIGLRREKLLILGVPLWVVLSGPERVALLSHELGHHVNRDVTHGVWATIARRSLIEWIRIFNPRESVRDRFARRHLGRSGPLESMASALVPAFLFVVCGPAFLLVLGCYVGLTRLDLRCGQRAEYLADELGARLASSAAAISLTQRLALAESVAYFVRRLKSERAKEDPWARLRAYIDSIPEHERRRRMLLDERRGTRIDATHPANYLRRKMLERRPQFPGTIEVDDAEWAAIDAELRKYFAMAAHSLIGTPLNAAKRVAA
ncbi:M48 family metallopeptidase [Actinocrinis sp.]|uniref:M48 family metallopeptidase n=1 Tax=Actinocrinis sp. TaxID=1920516 RepID=UPI002BB2AF99|nr:M48 family metallopeptidase [Actinocrinis sp.]HXR74284.1 M48 family metallopeptidase [Actinocrinis sp.]